MGPNSEDFGPIVHMINHNETTRLLKNYGYQFITLNTGYHATNIKSSDRYLTKPLFLDDFQNMLLNLTPIPLLLKKIGVNFQYDMHRERIIFSFQELQELATENRPFFVFAHIMACHHPYVFTENGDPINPDLNCNIYENLLVKQDWFTMEYYKRSYVNQLKYVNKQLIKTIDSILMNTVRPVIIILQGDHGFGILLDGQTPNMEFMKNRTLIFNAYYFYDFNYDLLYSQITPVNTFRVIFNQYFNNKFELLPDKNYFSLWSKPYNFTEITSQNGD
jgi:hypothetical protein